MYEEKDYGGYPMAGNELFEEEVLKRNHDMASADIVLSTIHQVLICCSAAATHGDCA